MGALLFRIGLCIACGTLGAHAQAFGLDGPRKDLYREIAARTGLSPRQAFEALVNHSKAEQEKLKFFAKKRGTEFFAKEVKEVTESAKNNCERLGLSEENCARSIEQVQKQAAHLEAARKNGALLWAAFSYSHFIHIEILQPQQKLWRKDCGEPGKINRPECKARFKQLSELGSIGTDLAGLAERTPGSAAKAAVQRKIAAYEP